MQRNGRSLDVSSSSLEIAAIKMRPKLSQSSFVFTVVTNPPLPPTLDLPDRSLLHRRTSRLDLTSAASCRSHDRKELSEQQARPSSRPLQRIIHELCIISVSINDWLRVHQYKLKSAPKQGYYLRYSC
jgi:hypothetical protein